jgi:hypothetical protein
MRIGVCVAVILGVGMVAQGYVVVNVSAPTPVTEPFTGELLDAYTVSLTAEGLNLLGQPAEVIALDVRFDSSSEKLHQLAEYKSGFGAHCTPTPMNDLAAEGFPADYVAADSHFLITSADAMWPTGKYANEDLNESYLPRDGHDVWHSWGTYLKSDSMGLSEPVQASTVPLARIVIPRGSLPGTVLMTGLVAGTLDVDPFDIGVILIPPIPEPGTLVLLVFGVELLARNVRKGGSK